MGKKAIEKTEIKILLERLEYLAGKIVTTKALKVPAMSKDVMIALGYKIEEQPNGKITYKAQEGFTQEPIDKIYIRQYYNVANKIERFYFCVNQLPTERLKKVVELRYVEGVSWKNIAADVGLTEQTLYSYRDIIADVFKKNECLWALGIDV